MNPLDFTSETSLLARVEALARSLGIHVHHDADSRRCEAGFPDLVLIGTRGVLFRELKDRYAELSSEQKALGYRLVGSGQDWDVWRPQDWACRRISAELEEIR